MYEPVSILSKNSKTGCSLNLPIKGHCHPTKTCSKCCYARRGNTALPRSKKKQTWVSTYLSGNDLSRLIIECKPFKAIRLCGTGDINPDHVPNIYQLAKTSPDTTFWGMTRKTDIAKALNNKLPNLKLMVSVDRDSPDSVWNYPGPLCWGPRMPDDQIPDDGRIIVTFPYHVSGKVIKAVKPHPKDCPSVWDHRGCLSCGKCWNW